MPMNPTALRAALKSQILSEMQALGWGQGGAPAEGSQAGNPNVAPSKIQDDLAEVISRAVADQMVAHIQQNAQATGLDSAGDTHALVIV